MLTQIERGSTLGRRFDAYTLEGSHVLFATAPYNNSHPSCTFWLTVFYSVGLQRSFPYPAPSNASTAVSSSRILARAFLIAPSQDLGAKPKFSIDILLKRPTRGRPTAAPCRNSLASTTATDTAKSRACDGRISGVIGRGWRQPGPGPHPSIKSCRRCAAWGARRRAGREHAALPLGEKAGKRWMVFCFQGSWSR